MCASHGYLLGWGVMPVPAPPAKLRSVHWTCTIFHHSRQTKECALDLYFFFPTPAFLRSVHWTLCKKIRGRPAPIPPYYPTPSPLTQRERDREG